MDIEKAEEHLREHWEKIEAKLRRGDYKPVAVRAVDIPKANVGIRTLGIPNVIDRMIQQAIHQVMSPAWEADFSEHSHGLRPGRSAHDAVREAQAYVIEGNSTVLLGRVWVCRMNMARRIATIPDFVQEWKNEIKIMALYLGF